MNRVLFKIEIAFAGLISFGSTSVAITPEPTMPTGWTKQATAAGTQYSNADGTAVVLEGVSMAAGPTVKLAAQAMDKPGACEGLIGQPVQKTARGVDKLSIVAGSVKCAVYLDTSISPPRLLVALDQGDGTGLRFAETIVGGWGRADAPAN